MVRAAGEAGIKLYATPGVIEEVCTHANKCKTYQHNKSTWVGRVPFLYMAHSINARKGSSFASWMELFLGETRSEDDVAEYFEDEFGIQTLSLSEEVDKADPELRSAISEEWLQIHEWRRREGRKEQDEHLAFRLAEHDTENYLGVIQRRSASPRGSPLGHTAWWLTMDTGARKVTDALGQRLKQKSPDSPVLSPDFLLNYMVFGPIRRQVSKDTEAGLPVILEGGIVEELPKDLGELVERIREETKDLPDRIRKRRIRDALDAAKRREGEFARGGSPGIEKRFGA